MENENMQPLPFLKNGVAQIAIVVKDLDKTVEQYYKVFGIGPWQFYTYEQPLVKKMSYKGQPAVHKNRLALSYFGNSRIELIEVLEGDSVYKDHIAKHGFGVQHLGFLVDDMSIALKQAKDAGLAMLQDGSGFGLDGDGHYAYLDSEEQFGVMIELIQRPKGRLVPEKIYPPE
jgi:catechol 2,3-dioxygenase-like lactoylglutathione lyase family enzyme